MAVQNRIVKIQKCNRALVTFDASRIWKAILRAANSIGGFPFDLPALKPFFIGNGGILPRQSELEPYRGFLDAHIRYDRVCNLLESVEGFTKEQMAGYELIPGDAVIREFVGGGTIKIPHNE